MAASPKRVTRRDLRRPDQFVALTSRLLRLFAAYRTQLLVSGAFVVALLLALWGWDLYRDRQTRLAAQEYSKALALYHAGKYPEALAALARVKAHSSSTYSRLALLYEANTYLALNEPSKAVPVLNTFLARERRDPLLRQLAFLRLAYAQETSNQCKEAVRSFDEAAKLEAAFKEDALLGKARCTAHNGDLKETLNAYRQHLSNYPGSERSSEVALRIQEIESRIQAAGAAKSK